MIETFSDGSQIITDKETGNRTVVGKIAHDEYLFRLRNERETSDKKFNQEILRVCTVLDNIK